MVTSHCIYPLDSYHVIQMWELLSLQPSLLNQLSTLLGIGTIFRTCHGVIATPFELQCPILITLNLGQIVPHFASLHFFPTSQLFRQSMSPLTRGDHLSNEIFILLSVRVPLLGSATVSPFTWCCHTLPLSCGSPPLAVVTTLTCRFPVQLPTDFIWQTSLFVHSSGRSSSLKVPLVLILSLFISFSDPPFLCRSVG